MSQKYFKITCLDCQYQDEARYPYQKKAVKNMARHHAKDFGHTIKETETLVNIYNRT